MIDEPACTRARADPDTTDDRADERGGECAAEGDRQEQPEQQAADQDCDRRREDDLRCSPRRGFFVPVGLAAIAAASGRETVALAARRRATAALHDRRGQTIATGGHPKVLLRFGDAASDDDRVTLRRGASGYVKRVGAYVIP